MSYTLIETKDELLGLAHVFLDNPDIVYADIESTGLDWLTDEILLFQLMHKNVIYVTNIRKIGYETLSKFLNWTSLLKFVFHNAKFDLKFLLRNTGVLLTNIYDTMICESLLTAGIGKSLYSLEDLAEKYADTFMDKEVRKEFINYPKDKEFTEQQLTYSAIDVKVLAPIVAEQTKQFEETKQVKVMELDNALIPVVAKMEYDGIRLNPDEWTKLEGIAKEKLNELFSELVPEVSKYVTTKKFRGVNNALDLIQKLKIPITGKARKKAMEEITDLSLIRGWIEEHFNFGSSFQKVALMNMYGIKATNANAKYLNGKFSDKPLVQKLLKIAEVQKQISQYGTGFLKDLNPITGRVHTEYFTVGTRTGRFSSSRPNLQNIPTDGGYRECFIPTEDYVFICCDYSQQEYRLTGAVSKEPVIINAYKNGSDMHIATASNFYKKSLEEVTKEERSWGKTRNFEIIYGTTEWGLSESLKSSIEYAQEILRQYWAGYPILSSFKNKVEAKIMELGYACTPLGRRRYNAIKPQYADSRGFLQWEAMVKREGFNHVIQGGGADIIKMAMVNMFHRNPFGEKFRILLQIHDEVLVEVHKSVVNEARQFIESEMIQAEQPFLKDIPAVVESSIKERWSK